MRLKHASHSSASRSEHCLVRSGVNFDNFDKKSTKVANSFLGSFIRTMLLRSGRIADGSVPVTEPKVKPQPARFRTGVLDEALRTSLIDAVEELEDLSDDMKEHEGSNGLVKNLINPSLYPFVNGSSLIMKEDKSRKKSPKSGPTLATTFLPMLSPTEGKVAAKKIFKRQEAYNFDDTFQWLPADVWVGQDGKARFTSYINNLNPVEYGDAYTCIEEIFSNLVPHFEGILKMPLKSRKLQVIVRMSNIELIPAPDKREYPGGQWHKEGMDNESITALGLYYYSISNVTKSFLELDWDGWSTSKIPTTENSFVVFRNTNIRHRAQKFKLKDKKKPGHRKLLAFFLCDPEKEILSTGRVPPQQREWYFGDLRAAFPSSRFPQEILEHLASFLPGTITKRRARQVRDEMMRTRITTTRRLHTSRPRD